jgi:hypothetical protein
MPHLYSFDEFLETSEMKFIVLRLSSHLSSVCSNKLRISGEVPFIDFDRRKYRQLRGPGTLFAANPRQKMVRDQVYADV